MTAATPRNKLATAAEAEAATAGFVVVVATDADAYPNSIVYLDQLHAKFVDKMEHWSTAAAAAAAEAVAAVANLAAVDLIHKSVDDKSVSLRNAQLLAFPIEPRLWSTLDVQSPISSKNQK